jgi:hypothetical protein
MHVHESKSTAINPIDGRDVQCKVAHELEADEKVATDQILSAEAAQGGHEIRMKRKGKAARHGHEVGKAGSTRSKKRANEALDHAKP